MGADLTLRDIPDVTIFIPTHERPGYLARILAYWSHHGMAGRVVVCDSSRESFARVGDFGAVRYFPFPGVPFAEKVARCLGEVDTPLVVFNADDDFLAPRAVAECARFLREHPDHSSAQGKQAVFTVEGESLRFRPVYLSQCRMNVDSDDPGERLAQALSPYMNQFYAVHGTETFRDYFQQAAESGIQSGSLLEILLSLFSAVAGKHGILDVFYYTREQVKDSGGRRSKRLDAVLASPELQGECRAFFRAAEEALSARTGMGRAEAGAAVNRAVDGYLKNLPPPPGALARLRARVRESLPEGVVRAVRAARGRAEANPGPDFDAWLAGFGPGAREDLEAMEGHVRTFGPR